MVRKCCVQGCESTDLTILSHRFPRSERNAEVWKQSLGIKDISTLDLIHKYIVCSSHFDVSDYRNKESRFLNSTAKPKPPNLKTSIKNNILNVVQEVDRYEMVEILDESSEQQKTDQSDELECIDVYEFGDKINKPKLLNNISSSSFEEELYIASNEDLMEQQDSSRNDHIIPFKKQKLHTKIKKVMLFKNMNDDDDNSTVEEDLSEELFSGEENELHETINENEYHEEINGIKKESEYYEEEDELADEDLFDEGEFQGIPRIEIIRKLVNANEKIKELELKLETIQKAKDEMNKNMEAIKKIFNSGI